jgi:hypothetical protein
MSNETNEGQSTYLELSSALREKLLIISNSDAFAADATLATAFASVKQLVVEILNSPDAYPAWRIDDLEEQLASSRRIADRLASGGRAPSHGRGDKISDPPIYDGNRDALEGFVAQLRLKLFSDPTRFPTPAIRMAYTFNRLQGRAQAQILPFIKGGTIELGDAEDIIRILHNAFGDPDPVATARAKLSTLKQGKKEFNTYFAEFQMLVSKLNWNEDAKLDALREGLSHDLRRLLLGRTKNLTFDELVTLCQETDTESRAIHLSEGRTHQHSRNHQGHAPPRSTTVSAPPAGSSTANNSGHAFHPDAMDLSATGPRGKISEEERAARLREGRCLYCGGMGHLARNCPNKTRNPFRAAAAQMEPNPRPNPNTPMPSTPNTHAQSNPFSGGGGNRGGNGGGQSGNA